MPTCLPALTELMKGKKCLVVTFKKTSLFYELSLKYLLFGEGKKKKKSISLQIYVCLPV